MKELTTRDLNESLTLFIGNNVPDGEGGFLEKWEKGPRIWASLWPLSQTTEHESQHVPPCRYKLYMRAGVKLPQKVSFLWTLYRQTKHLMVVSSPVLIQQNKFMSMTVVEAGNA